MQVNEEIYVDANQQAVWNALNDPNVLKAATPGCKSLTEIGEDHYKANISLGIAAVRGEYDAEIQIKEKEEPNRYRILMQANSPMGFVEGDAVVQLNYKDNKTAIQYNGTAKVGGMIAGVGQRVLGGISKLIVKDFFKTIAKEVKASQSQ